ncbi:MAG: hypothetical protein ACK559_08105, partial [bacterium]
SIIYRTPFTGQGNGSVCRNTLLDSSLEQAENIKPNMKRQHLLAILINFCSMSRISQAKAFYLFTQ